ncbi:hypothetical protein OCU04_002526 [Sclerotinia nivalis]|uniref:Uncharacterized protein n=1 Tax=Sclerotinia nivalis TaxID=352851 RepID=A0A9X0DMA6_9HELO|nr:hypothetical protein OCU04_002526 [Sclerotinia nivalis]
MEEKRKRELSPKPDRRRRSMISALHSQREGQERAAGLQLPSEIPEMILLEVPGGNMFHLIQCHRQLGHFRCKQSHSIDDARTSQYDITRTCVPSLQHRKHMTYNERVVQQKNTILHKLRFLSPIFARVATYTPYNQGIPILYSRKSSRNTCNANNPETLPYLSQTILPADLTR